MRRILLASVPLLVSSLLLAGCSVVQFDKPSTGDKPRDLTPGVADCTGEDITWDQSRSTVTFAGSCGTLTVIGSLVVISAGSFENVVIKGDGVVLDAEGAIGGLSIEGGDNTISAANVGSVVIAGDRNALDADTVTGLSIDGDDNGVDAVVSGDVADNGSGNSIGE
jgi:hypothetical protein